MLCMVANAPMLLREEHHGPEASLGYMVRAFLKKVIDGAVGHERVQPFSLSLTPHLTKHHAPKATAAGTATERSLLRAQTV